jgi:hypothetical protein
VFEHVPARSFENLSLAEILHNHFHRFDFKSYLAKWRQDLAGLQVCSLGDLLVLLMPI